MTSKRSATRLPLAGWSWTTPASMTAPLEGPFRRQVSETLRYTPAATRVQRANYRTPIGHVSSSTRYAPGWSRLEYIGSRHLRSPRLATCSSIRIEKPRQSWPGQYRPVIRTSVESLLVPSKPINLHQAPRCLCIKNGPEDDPLG